MSKRKQSAKQLAISFENKITAIYLRVSTEEQADSGLGLAAQQERCTAMATAKDLPNVRIYGDAGISGTLDHTKRAGLAEIIELVKSGKVGTIIVLDLSRLARSVKLVTSYIELFNDYDVNFISCKESFDTSTAMGKAMLNLVAVFGQLERDLTSERTVSALAERKKTHGYASGKLPLGYSRDSETEVISINDDAKIVRSVFTWRNDKQTLQQIADRVTDATGKKYYPSTIKVILDNEAKYRGNVFAYPQILY